MVAITLPDGSVKSFPQPVSGVDVATAIGPGLAKAALAMKVDGKLVDLKKVNVSERFWVGPLAGSSAVLLKLKISDDGAKETVAEPTFYAKANAWGGAFTFAATDNAMLSRVVSDACDYARRNL